MNQNKAPMLPAPRTSSWPNWNVIKLGGEVSDRQWRGIMGVMKVQTGKLDMDYLQRGAKLLKITDLLDRALQ